MKIAAKISAGYGILIALIVAVLTYQVALFYQMQSINRDLSAIDFRTAILSLQLLRDLDQVEEFTRKFYATEGDPDYAKQLQGMRNACSQRMAELKSLAVSAAEGAEIAQLSRIWDELSRASAEQQKAYDAKKLPEAEAGLSAQLNLFSKIQVQAQFVIRATRRAIESRLEQSTEAGRRAQRISWMAAAAALVLSLAGAFWIVGSISGALRRLTAGTRAVAEGKFLYQLEEKGNDELASLTRDFNSMTRRLSELDNLKKDFVSHVSHELKTPLASVQETIRLLLDEIPGPLNEQQRRFLELNLQSSKRLSSLIGNLLDVSKMDAGVLRYQMQQHDLAALVRTALDEFEAPLRERSFHLQAEIPDRPVPVHCDADRMIQVLSNLLGNALKFAPEGSVLCVCLTHSPALPTNVPMAWRNRAPRARHDEGFVLLSVADRGAGIPDNEKERVFEKFYQTRQGGQVSCQGAGLGLAIGRTIVEAHGGAIWVEDNPGGGSIFFVLLPLAEPAAVQTSLPI